MLRAVVLQVNARALGAEGLGTAFLLTAVVGSGIMGDRLSAGNSALALLANSIATGAALVTLILTFGPISGAHFNPVITLAAAHRRSLPGATAAGYVVMQVCGAVAGVAVAHVMFGEPLFAASQRARSGAPLLAGEFVATFGLLTIVISGRQRANTVPFAVGAYITSAYWFTSSTSFANPAVTVARALTNSFTGIRLEDVPAFIGAQAAGALAATILCGWLFPRWQKENG